MRKSDVEITRPLKHRPGVIIVRSNGTRKIIGDGHPFSPAEFIEIHGGYSELTSGKLKLSDDEQAQIAEKLKLLGRATAAVERLYNQKQDIVSQILAMETRGHLEEDDILAIERLSSEVATIESQIAEAKDIEQAALIASNETKRRVTREARARQFPVEYANQTRSFDDRLNDLEGNE